MGITPEYHDLYENIHEVVSVTADTTESKHPDLIIIIQLKKVTAPNHYLHIHNEDAFRRINTNFVED